MTTAKRILVVEDEPRVMVMVRKRLELNGYRVITAIDGREAVEVAQRERPDLIVLDLMLPKLDGYEVCRLLRHDPACAQIPILMLTARTQDEDIRLGMVTGANAYLTKPFDAEVLLGRIAELIDEQEQEAARRADREPPKPETLKP